MNATLHNLHVLTASTRAGDPDPKTGDIATFASITCFDPDRPASRPLSFWAFASDLAALPETGDVIDVVASPRAKEGQYGPYISWRIRSYTVHN